MKLNYRSTLLVGFAFFSITLFWQVYDSMIPKVLENVFGFSNTMRGFIMALDNIVALAMLPLFGHLSDRTKTRFGKRTPYIVCGTILSAAAFVAVGVCASPGMLAPFIAVLALDLLFMSSYRSPAVALMPDITVKPLRSRANAIINLMGAVGGILALVMMMVLVTDEPSSYLSSFVGTAIVMLLSLAFFLIFVRENKLVRVREEEEKRLGIAEDNEEVSEGEKGARPDRAQRRSMLFLLLSVVFWFMAYNAVTSSFSVYAQLVWGIGGGDFSLPLMIASGAAIVAYVPVGMLAARLGRRKTIFVGLGFLFLAFLGATVFGTTYFGFDIDFSHGNYFSDGWFYLICVFFALCGIGWATISVNSYPMAVEMSRAGNVGKYTGYYYTASMLAQSVTPFISGILMDLGTAAFGAREEGMMLLFPYALFFVLLAALTMCFVRHGDAKPPARAGIEAFDVED